MTSNLHKSQNEMSSFVELAVSTFESPDFLKKIAIDLHVNRNRELNVFSEAWSWIPANFHTRVLRISYKKNPLLEPT